LKNHVEEKVEEKQRLEEQLQDAGALLQSKNVDIETISESSQLKEHLAKHNLSLEAPTKLLSILQTIKQIGYEPVKIVAAFASRKSLMQKGEAAQKKLQSARIAHGKISTSTTSGSMQISIDELLAFDILAKETAQTSSIPISTTAFRVIKEIKDYRKTIGLKKKISRLAVQRYTMNEIGAKKITQ